MTDGGFLPVFVTSVSVVIFVVPPGVATVVSCLLDAVFSAQPAKPIDTRLAIRIAVNMRFIFKPFR